MSDESRKERKGATHCDGHPVYLEGLYVVHPPVEGRPQKVRFGHVPVCTRCQRPVGDYKLYKGTPRTFNATSWAVMTRVHPWPPYAFEERDGQPCLVPEGYRPENDATTTETHQ